MSTPVGAAGMIYAIASLVVVFAAVLVALAATFLTRSLKKRNPDEDFFQGFFRSFCLHLLAVALLGVIVFLFLLNGP